MIWFLFNFIFLVLGFAFLIDWRRKKINNNPPNITHPHAKPGDDSNYMMGDNRDHGGSNT
ncbi:hypothetical protein [Bacillus sp. UMB0728]|jgi:hypothetical protein|uniref:hypothetical protein n=1 Tax=Bacillus sp. UMB0728 TaxID=2066052 RepID=UPI000C781A9F|nr:hypothetical protein [Bacillus sp. UMB0728]PLR74746.1 hypothetical protein CYJ37_03750 [Bacillus sp. UMB0728]